MKSTLLTLILFTSLTGIVSAMDDASQADGHSKRNTFPSGAGESLETFGPFKAAIRAIIEDLKGENRRLKQQLAQRLNMFPASSSHVLNLVSSDQKPKEYFVDRDHLHSPDEEAGVAFVQRIFADFRKRLRSIVTDLEQENSVLKLQLSEYDRALEHADPSALSPRKIPPIDIDSNTFEVPPELSLPLVPDDDREKKRSIVFFEGEHFMVYDVSGFNANCAFNITDFPREKVIKELKVPEHLLEEVFYIKAGKSISPLLLPHIGQQMLKANVRVLTGTAEFGVIVDAFDEKEYASVKQNGCPTFYVLNNGSAHFQILIPIKNSMEYRLFRRYTRKKEDLRREGIQRLDTPIESIAGNAADSLDDIMFPDLQAAIRESLQIPDLYDRLTTLQYLNGGQGGWLQSYVVWVKSLQGK